MSAGVMTPPAAFCPECADPATSRSWRGPTRPTFEAAVRDAAAHDLAHHPVLGDDEYGTPDLLGALP